MVPTDETAIDSAPPVKRPRGRPRKAQSAEIDTWQPLHPWASTSKHQQLSTATASTSYLPPKKARAQPQEQQQHYVSAMQPPPQPHAAAPITTSSFYAQPQQQPQAYVVRASATPAPAPVVEPQYVMPMIAPRQNIPTRKDLEFLLGGPPRVRERSSTPSTAGFQARASVAPADSTYPAAAPRRTVSAAQYQYQTEATPVAGSSQSSVQQQEPAAARLSVARHSAPSRRPRQIDVFPGDEDGEADLQDYDEDDGLALGAEAVMESDHDGDYADAEDETLPNDHDDPNDGDFRPNNSAKRIIPHSHTSGHAADASGSVSTPPGATTSAPRRSLASSSTAGKVPGSATKADPSDPNEPPKRRGRWRKEDYTPDVLEKIKAANEILAVALEASAEHPTEKASRRKSRQLRLDDVLDRKTVQSLSPEMQAALRRARNTQLQRERRERLRAEAGWTGKRRRKAPVGPFEGVGVESSAGEDKRRGRKHKIPQHEGDEVESGSGIVERARGKVFEWMKNVSSEAEMSVEPEMPFQTDGEGGGGRSFSSEPTVQRKGPSTYPRRSVSQTHMAATIATLPSSSQQQRRESSPLTPDSAEAKEKAREGTLEGGLVRDIDPRLQADSSGEQGFFSRFGTVTGKVQPVAPDTPAPAPVTTAVLAVGTGIKPDISDAGVVGEKKDSKPAYEAGVMGDEYYFST
ncbi:hypothetical protein NDA17_001547 [Ustilago hordei]|nr:hypothetical protein NDA17_001547 [Ustilago hordei]